MMSSVPRREPGPPLTLLANADPAIRQYLEDLVSIGVASAERADDALQEVQFARRKATRAAWAFASVAAISAATGVAGVISVTRHSVADSKVVELAGQVRSLNEQQVAANHQLTAVSSAIADEREALEASKQTAAPVQHEATGPGAGNGERPVSIPPAQPIVEPRVSPVQQATYSSPWPIHTQSVRRTWSTEPRQAPVPRFISVIQQNLRALFR